MMAPTCVVHSDQLAMGTCPRCGNYLCTRCVSPERNECASCRERSEGAGTPTPWERRADIGWVQGFWQTLKAMTLTPGPFFASVRPQAAKGEALSFAWLAAAVSTPALALNLMMQLAFVRLQLSRTFETLAERGAEVGPYRAALEGAGLGVAILYALATVLSTPMTVAFSAAATHAGLALLGGAANGFRGTFRAVGYVAGLTLPVAVLGLVPGIGGLAGLGVIGYQVYAVAQIQRISIGKAIGAVLLLPLVFTCCFGVTGTIAMVGMVSGLVRS